MRTLSALSEYMLAVQQYHRQVSARQPMECICYYVSCRIQHETRIYPLIPSKFSIQYIVMSHYTVLLNRIKIFHSIHTLTSKSGHSPRAFNRVGVQSFAIHRAAATIPQCAYPKTKLPIPPSFKTE